MAEMDNKMRIVLLQGAFLPVPPVRGGAVEKIWDQLGRELVSQGHEVIHISKKYPSLPDNENKSGVKHVRVKGYEPPGRMLVQMLMDFVYSWRAIRRIPRNADVIVTNTFWSPVLLRGSRGRKVYVDVGRTPRGQMKYYKHVGRYRANSNPVADAIRAEIPVSVHNKVGMVPNPLPFNQTEKNLFTQKSKEILYTGRIHPEKGIELLVEAFAGLGNKEWKLKIIGPWEVQTGGGGPEYIAKLKSLAGDTNVEFIDPIFNIDELNKHYRTASVFVYPSLADKGETFGLAPLEGMAWGCVPVVSAIPCFQDFIVPGVNGMVFDHHTPDRVQMLAAKLEQLIADPQLRERISGEAIKVNGSHSISAVARMFIEDFKKLQHE
ncbi:MAG: glycosyltransferase [Chitinophagaceae bacterium]|nr:MAG: glycosyltransferase [Chitinophagaceae bacterium]